jgi:hypothetical protein
MATSDTIVEVPIDTLLGVVLLATSAVGMVLLMRRYLCTPLTSRDQLDSVVSGGSERRRSSRATKKSRTHTKRHTKVSTDDREEERGSSHGKARRSRKQISDDSDSDEGESSERPASERG